MILNEMKEKVFRNRKVIGAFCIILALLIGFVLVPFVTNVTGATTFVVQAKQYIPAGTKITAAMLDPRVRVGRSNLPAGVVRNSALAVGQYAAVDISAQDDITTAKLSSTGSIYNLADGQYLISVTVKNFADGLSGKLQQGDIVTITIPPASATSISNSSSQIQRADCPQDLQYVEVAAVTASTGADTDPTSYKKSASGNSGNDLPATVTLLVNGEQMQTLATHENDSLHLALACRGNGSRAKDLLQLQADYFEQGGKASSQSATSAPSDTASDTASTGNGKQSAPANQSSKGLSSSSTPRSSSSSQAAGTGSSSSTPSINWGVSK